MSRPTLSVVMPNYNHAEFLPQAIDQIVEQSHPPDEFLIWDDASTDESRSIIEDYAKRHSFIHPLYAKENLGVIEAHRQLFEKANGDYIYAGAADDMRFPQFFEQTMGMAKQYPHAGLIAANFAIGDEMGKTSGVMQVRNWEESCYATPEQVLVDYLERESPPHSLCTSTVYRRDALKEMGWYRPELGYWGDTFSARAVALKYGMCYVPETLAMWRRLDTSFSGTAREDSENILKLISRAVQLMQSPPFVNIFPAEHVHRWEKRYRRLVVFNQWMGEGVGLRWKSPRFWARGVLRMPQLVRGLNLLRRFPANT